MASGLVLVNGLPGSGKTTLGGSIAAALDVPLVSKDVIKEALADVAAGTVASRRLGQIASDTMWELAAAIPGTAVVESWWHAPRDLAFVTAGVARSGTPRLVQVWCEVPADVARRRYDERRRHPIHVVDEEARMQAEEWTEFSPLPHRAGGRGRHDGTRRPRTRRRSHPRRPRGLNALTTRARRTPRR